MRIPTTRSRLQASWDVTLTPMIDMVFLLLIFFLWTASFRLPEQHVQVDGANLSESTAMAAQLRDIPEEEQLVLRIEERMPRWSVNGVSLSNLSDLRARLTEIAGIQSDLPVLIHPQGTVTMEDVMDVYDVAKRAGLRELQFAVHEEEMDE